MKKHIYLIIAIILLIVSIVMATTNVFKLGAEYESFKGFGAGFLFGIGIVLLIYHFPIKNK